MELLISTRRYGSDAVGTRDTKLKKAGDVICAKPDGAPWGRREREDGFAIIRVSDDMFPEIASRLAKRASESEPHPVAAYPFALTKEIEESDGKRTITRQEVANRSAYRLDMRALEGADTLDPAKSVGAIDPGLTIDNFIHDTTDRSAL